MNALGNLRLKVFLCWPPVFMPRSEKGADGCTEKEEGGLNIEELGCKDEMNRNASSVGLDISSTL